MLKAQQTPKSAGNVVKMAPHLIGIPFHEQNFKNDLSNLLSMVKLKKVKNWFLDIKTDRNGGGWL